MICIMQKIFYKLAGICGRSFSRRGNALSGKWKYCGTFECSTWMYRIRRQDFDGENCHKSVYNAVDLNGLIPEYVYPEFDETTDLNGEIRAEKIEQILERTG